MEENNEKKKSSSKTDYRKKISMMGRKPIRKVKKEEVKSDKEENTFMVSSFPFVIGAILLILFGVLYYIINTYKKVIILDSDGFFITSKSSILLGNKKKDDKGITTFNVLENDTIYERINDFVIKDNKKMQVNLNYPFFINNGLSIVNYNDNVNLINSSFERSNGFNGLILTYGKAYDRSEHVQIDKENYLLMSYKDGINVTLYDMKIKTTLNEYDIPTNSFIYFSKENISYYERDNDKFNYKVISDIDYKSLLTFYYNGSNEEYEYNYEAFLEGIGTIFKSPEVIPNKEEEIKPSNPVVHEKKPAVHTQDSKTGEFKYEKPSVSLGEFSVNVYSIRNKITINDPAGVIVNAPTFTLYNNGRIYSNRTFYTSSDIVINGLLPENEFTIVGKYTYLDEDMETKKIVTFYVKTIKTKELSSLPPIELSFENGNIYPKKIELNNVKVVSDLNSEAIMGVNKISLNIDNNNYYLNVNDVSNIISGRETQISTSESLKSSQVINYEFKFFDRAGNEIKSIRNKGETRTSKRPPLVTLRLKNNKVDNVEVGINLRNEDNLNLSDYKYTLTNSSGRIISQDLIDGNSVFLSNLSPDQIFTISVSADIDIDDGGGIHNDYVLSTMEFTTKPITSLGYVNMNIKSSETKHNKQVFKYSLNARKTDAILVKLLKKLTFEIYDSNNELVDRIVSDEEIIERFKNKEELELSFNNLKSDTNYSLVIKSTISQGEEIYVFDCVYSILDFTTYKTPARVDVMNSFTTQTMLDFDFKVVDEDKAIISDYIRVELRDEDNKIIDLKMIDIIDEETRVTYNNLETLKFYTVNFYADEYNETNYNEFFKYKQLISTFSVYTDEGISGKVELVSSLRKATGTNLVDVRSEVKWLQTEQYYTIPKKVDDNGDIHIYSKTGGSAYTYDLSDYHGKIVTISFKAKALTQTNYKLYFTQYFSGTTSNGYSKEVEGVNQNNWTEFSYTFKVGSLSYTASNYFAHYSTMTYGKNYNDSAGFYINGGNEYLTEFAIRDLDVHIQYDEELVDISDNVLERGYYNSNGKENNTNNAYYVRYKDSIFLEGGSYYSLLFDNDNTYKFYVYIYKTDDKYERAFGYYASESTFYIPEDRYVRIFFRYRDGQGELSPSDIKNVRLVKHTNNNVSANPTYEYELETKLKVNLTDKRDEIIDDNYFITVYENNVEIYNNEYVELKDTNTISNVIKKIGLDENKNYIVALRIKVRDRYYTLNTFDISTDDESRGVSSINDWRFIQPYGNYIVLNDLDFVDYTDQRLGWGYRYFYGKIDFQGYKMKLYTTNTTDGTSLTQYRKINRLETTAVIKNVVIDLYMNNQSINNNLNGVFGTNYGLIENVIINIHDTHNKNMPQLYVSPLLDNNTITGTVRNFVIKLDGDVNLYSDSAFICRTNYGVIENGYVYGGNIIADYSNNANPTRNIGAIFRYGGVKSRVSRVYALTSVNMPLNQSNDKTGVFGYETYGKIENAYVVGDSNPNFPDAGPIVAYPKSTARFNDVYYFSDNIYTSTMQQKSSKVSLTDSKFQNDILGNAFNVDELLELGFYPQVRFSSNKMPIQDFIDLPIINANEYADIISFKVISQTNDEATVSVNINNILGEEVSSIQIADVKTEIISQTYFQGKTTLILKVSSPEVYVSRYQVRSISTRSTSGYISTRKYDLGEKYLMVDFYKEIHNVDEFIKINNGLNQNYAIMEDLDFDGYVKFHINNFIGKLEGNNHTLKNIELTMASKNGLFNQMNGTMKNIIFDKVYIKTTTSSQLGIVGYSNQNASYYNVHVNNINIEVPDTMTRENVYIGGLVANSSSAKIDYCSVSNITVKSTANVFGIVIGGMVGYSSASIINNSFVQNVNIVLENAASSNGLGGIIGREASSVGMISDSYSTGTIISNSQYVGGITGNSQGYIENSFSTVDVSSDMSYMGGIVGYTRENIDCIKNTLYLGNIYTSSTDGLVRRIAGNYNIDDTNYAMRNALINGVSSDQSNGENLVSYSELLKDETYNNIFSTSNAFDTSKSSEAIVPKLYFEDDSKLMPYQNDVELFENIFNINEIVIDKKADYANITMYLDNPSGFNITRANIEGATAEIIRNVNVDNITVLEFKLIPTKYHDNYKFEDIYYLDSENNEVRVVKNYRIDAIFYKNLSSFDDWQKISKTDPENYLLTNNIDFSTKEKVNYGVVFNRLETAGENINYSLSGFNLNVTKNQNYTSIISKIQTSFKNIIIKNVQINDTSTSANNYSNILLFNYATLNNLRFENITINSPKENYVSIIGENYAQNISNITLDKINVNGNQRVGGFIARATASVENNYNNINANEVNINASGVYAGGIIASFTGGVGTLVNPIYNNMNISNSNIISSSYYVGGITGYGDASNSRVFDTYVKGSYYVGGAMGTNLSNTYNIEVNDSRIEGTDYYIGGIFGSAGNIYDSTLVGSEVIGLGASTHSVGGVFGYKTGSTTSRVSVVNSTISNNGTYTGGLGGTQTGGTLSSSFITDSVVSGDEYSGGMVGRITYPTIQYNKTIKTIVNSVDKYSGGIGGIFDNDNSFGNTNEGYVRECQVLSSNINASSYAGGFFGKIASDFNYANRVRRLYSDSSVTSEDNTNYGATSGDGHDKALLNQPAIYLYENTIVASSKLVDTLKENNYGPDILGAVNIHKGFVNSNGTVLEDASQINLEYTDLIRLDGGKRYEIDIEHTKQSNIIDIYLYDANGKFYYKFNSGNVENYIDKYHDLTYVNNLKFRVYKDCYIRISFTNISSLVSRTLKEISYQGVLINQDNLLSSKELKDRFTWTNYINASSTIRYDLSKMNLNKDYFDFSVLNQNTSRINIPDKVSGKNLSIYASGSQENGLAFDGIDDMGEISNFNLPNNNITFETSLNSFTTRSYQWIFSKRDHTNKTNGFGVFIHAKQIYVWIYNTWYATGIYIPNGRDVTISVTYENNKYLKVYLNGNLLYEVTANKKLINNANTKTYIAYDAEHPSESYRFIGTIKNIMVYDRVLTQTEITNNYYSSSGITNNEGLTLHYDFTGNLIDNNAYYPILKWNNEDYEIKNEPLVSIPNDILPPLVGASAISKNSLYSAIPSYYIYPSGIDTINVEFKEISKDMNIEYIYKGKTYKENITKKVYTLNYDYTSPAIIKLSNAFESISIDLTKEKYSKQIKIYNGKYYYINDNKLYENDNLLINDAYHIYNNLVVLKDNKIYNIETKEITSLISNEGILGKSIPLYTSSVLDTNIQTYYSYTLVNEEEKEGQIILNNDNLYIFNNQDIKGNNIIFNKYNNLEYQIVLLNNGKIKSYKEDISSPLSFVNANISEISFDSSSNEPVIMIKYLSGDILVFNYVNGKKLYETNKGIKSSVFEFISSEMYQEINISSSERKSFKQNKKLEIELNNISSGDVSNKLDSYIDYDNNISNNLSNKYINTYNSSLGTYEIYNVNEILGTKSNKTVEEDEIIKLDTKEEIKSKSINDKLRNDMFLYNYFYVDKKVNKINSKKIWIYSIILISIVINLIILSVKYGSKESKVNEK